jgi:capsular polysaccharide export protein
VSRRILILVDNLPRAQFFARFQETLITNGITCDFLCYKRSSYQHLKQRSANVHLLTLQGHKQSHSINEAVCRRSLDVLRGDISLNTAVRKAEAMVPALQQTLETIDPDTVFIWNGSQLVERVLGELLPTHVERRYFEIANIPGKIFVDPEGVNAASSLFRDPSNLSITPAPSDEEYQSWRKHYLAEKKNAAVPQAKTAQSIPWERPLDALASGFGRGFYPMQLNRMASRVQGKLRTRRLVRELHETYPSTTKRPYLFLPFQVSEDTQLLLNSEIENVGALERCVDRANEQGLALVAKIHPAENSLDAVKQLTEAFRKASAQVEFALSTQSTTELIANAQEVCTINSTVGLEALIIGKPLTVLGRALFVHFTARPELLRTYLLRYLISVDYFSNAPITNSALNAILERRAGVPCTIS